MNRARRQLAIRWLTIRVVLVVASVLALTMGIPGIAVMAVFLLLLAVTVVLQAGQYRKLRGR